MLRTGDQQAQAPAPESHPNAVTATPEAQTPPPVEDPVAKALSDPRVLAAVNDTVQQSAAAHEQARQAYEQGLAQNAALLVGNLQSRHAELRGLPIQQWPVVLQSLNQSNPRRATEILQELEGTRNFFAQAQQAEAVRQQQVQAQYQAYQQETQRHYADGEDAKYTEFEKTRPAAGVKAVRENVLRVLSSLYNMPEADFVRAYQTDPTARSAAMQRMAYDVTAAQLAREGAAAKAVRPVPTVQRPGSPLERGSESDYDMRKLNDRLNRSTGRDALRAAAEIVSARRARRA